MSVSHKTPAPQTSHAWRISIVAFAVVALAATLLLNHKTAQASLLPSHSAEQMGRDTISAPAQIDTQQVKDPETPTWSINDAQPVVESQASVTSELGVPDELKEGLAIKAPADLAPRQALPVRQVYKYIVVDLSEQRVYAKENGVTVFTDLISSGLTGPTPIGHFKIYARYYNTCMSGPGYNLCNIRRTQYFTGDYSIHEAWWHNNFGHPMSHGCVNMRFSTADWFWNWANIGTDVYVKQ